MNLEGEKIFPDPHEVPIPEGAEGWEEMYPSSILFGKDREELEDSDIWFQLSSHAPDVIYPIDFSFGIAGIGNMHAQGTLILPTPTAWGQDGRVLNGYYYQRSSEITEPKIIEERASIFMERARFLINNWDELWRKWKEKCLKLAEEIEGIYWPELKLIEDLGSSAFQGRSWDKDPAPAGMALLRNWNKLKNLMYETLYTHMEPVNLAMSCYLIYRDSFLKAFPDTAEKVIADTLTGIEQPMMEGDFHLRELAALVVKLGIQDVIKEEIEPGKILKKLEKTNAGKKWLGKWEESKLWFHLTNGSGQRHYHTSWLDDLKIPFGILRNYVFAVERGEKVAIDRERKVREAVKLFEGYRDLLPTEEDRKAFTEIWEGARKVAVALEGHGFYSDQWLLPSGFRKIRELGDYLYRYGVFKEPDDIRYLNHFEVEEILVGFLFFWYNQTEPRVKPVQEKIERRKRIIKVLASWTPPPFLVGKKAKIPERITAPYSVVLFGATKEKIEEAMKLLEKVKEIKGWGASSGVYEGTARVVKDPIAEIEKIKEGDILVTNFLYPSQAVVFSKIKGLVADSGGVISHPAIIAREYSIPAVVGAAIGMTTLKDGMRIRIDRTKGVVTILK